MTFKGHMLYVLFVSKILKGELDWRLPVFECGRYLIALDGAALLLNEIYNQKIEIERSTK